VPGETLIVSWPVAAGVDDPLVVGLGLGVADAVPVVTTTGSDGVGLADAVPLVVGAAVALGETPPTVGAGVGVTADVGCGAATGGLTGE
jgi:hypothetical protein